MHATPTTQDFVQLYTPPRMDGQFFGKHIVTVEQFTRADLTGIFNVTHRLRDGIRRNDPRIVDLARGKVMATLFYESSTRTDMSFQAAMRRLGGTVIGASNGVHFSSVYKGENLADTVRAAACYADVVVLRHPNVGATYEAAYYLDKLSERLARQPVLISGGDGVGEHPTQALLDLFTLLDYKPNLNGLTITLVGDLKYGRTVHSLAKLLGRFESMDTRLCFVSPEALRMPRAILDTLPLAYTETDDLQEVIGGSDVIYWTRVQEERFSDPAAYEAIRDAFIMTPEVLAAAKPDAILMHPLPRKHEMGTPADHDILDADPRAVYFQQMENGMFVRMALLALVTGVMNVAAQTI